MLGYGLLHGAGDVAVQILDTLRQGHVFDGEIVCLEAGTPSFNDLLFRRRDAV